MQEIIRKSVRKSTRKSKVLERGGSDTTVAPDPIAPLSEEQIAELKKGFQVFDKDGNGSIGKEELGEVLRSMGNVVTKEVLDNMFEEVDRDGNGSIDLGEFLVLMRCWSKCVVSCRNRLGGFVQHFVYCVCICILDGVMGILLLSDMGWGSSSLDGLNSFNSSWLPMILIGISFTLLLLLYCLDFFFPPHLPERKLTLSENHPCFGRFFFAAAIILLIGGSLPLLTHNNSHRALLMTMYGAPASLILLGLRIQFHHDSLKKSIQQKLEDSGSALEIVLFKLIKDIAMEEDDVAFYSAALYALVGAGSLCIVSWVPWAAFESAPKFSSHDSDYSFVLWVSPLLLGLGMLVFASMVLLRVRVHDAYTAMGKKVKRASSNKLMGSNAKMRARGSVPRSETMDHVQTMEHAQSRAQHRLQVLKNTLKIMVGACICVFGLVMIISNLALPDSPIVRMIRDTLVCFTVSFVIFIIFSFSKLMSQIWIGAKDMPMFKSVIKLSSSHWAHALVVSCVGPFFLIGVVLSFINQLFRRCRGIHHLEEEASNDAAPASSIDTISAKWTECVTFRLRVHIVHATRWDWISVGNKLHILCSILIALLLCPLLFDIFFAFVIDLLHPVHVSLAILIFLALGITALLIPTVPTTTVYVFGGVVITEKWMSLPSVYGGFWVGIVVCIMLSLGVKLLGRFLQYQCFGKALGKSLRVQQICKVHTPIMRTIAMMMAEPGICRIGKVAVLCGVPDWPMGVGAGILRLPLLHVLIGTVPILFFIAPCVMMGGFYMRKDEAEIWDNAFVLMIVFIGIVNVVFQVLAAHNVQKTFAQNMTELSRPSPEHIELHWLDHCINELQEANHVKWYDLSLFLRLLVLVSCVTQILVLHTFFWAWDMCFGRFAVTDDIKDLRWHGNDSVVKPIGVLSLVAFLVSCVTAYALHRVMQCQRRAKCIEVEAELKKAKEDWVKNWSPSQESLGSFTLETLEEVDAQREGAPKVRWSPSSSTLQSSLEKTDTAEMSAPSILEAVADTETECGKEDEQQSDQQSADSYSDLPPEAFPPQLQGSPLCNQHGHVWGAWRV